MASHNLLRDGGGTTSVYEIPMAGLSTLDPHLIGINKCIIAITNFQAILHRQIISST